MRKDDRPIQKKFLQSEPYTDVHILKSWRYTGLKLSTNITDVWEYREFIAEKGGGGNKSNKHDI